MEIPDHVISDICIKLREVLHTLESYSDSASKAEPVSEIELTSSQVSFGLWFLLDRLKKNSTIRPSDIPHT
jgi:hypothetical protein